MNILKRLTKDKQLRQQPQYEQQIKTIKGKITEMTETQKTVIVLVTL